MTTASTPTPPPRFRGCESAISRYGQNAVHIIGTTAYLYRKNELVGPINDLPKDVTENKSVAVCIQTARNVLADWAGLSMPAQSAVDAGKAG
jgi:hypothetical protein